jgi:uncharacterized protein (DUF697 family)
MEAAQMTKKDEKNEVETTEAENRLDKANAIMKNRMMWSAGAGLFPIPVVDMVALSGIQLEMLYSFSKLYDVPFRKDIGKSVIASLLGSVLPTGMAPGLASLIKAIPLIGQTTGALTMSIVGGASTYAVGKIFIQHFEAGGTFLDFNPAKVKDHFAELYEKGKSKVST